MRRLDNITNSTGMNLSKLWETVKDMETWRAAVHGAAKSQIWLSAWTPTKIQWLPSVSLHYGHKEYNNLLLLHNL